MRRSNTQIYQTMDNKKLTEKRYWDARFRATGKDKDVSVTDGGFWLRFYHRHFEKIKHGYSRYLLFDVMCRKYLPCGEKKVIEIGCAPGTNLVAIHDNCGYTPYGVEYIEAGVRANRQLFEKNGLNPENIIYSDFFADDFQKRYAGYFDIVMSHGFIEHFSDTRDAIDKHLSLLKPNGYLFITVPNFRGLNYLLVSLFAPHTIKAHNLSIMKKSNFLKLFEPAKVDIVRCQFIGTYNFGLIYGTNKSAFKLKLMYLCMAVQKMLDTAFYLLFKNGGVDSFLFSPHLMMICRKRDFHHGTT
jgi:2-polyprenyl-3-methyl-5-hydroxy-6-metoxy-1,4-benzoquinol methylase